MNTNFKKVSYRKIDWLRNISENGGAMNEVISKKKAGEVVIHSHTSKLGRLWASMTPTDILHLIQKNSGLYEVITDYPYKVYFDIDKVLPDTISVDEYYNKITNKINELFPDPYAAVSGSFEQGKASYHITLNNYLICNDNERETMKLLVKQLNESFDDGFDWKVYTKNRNFKLINQSKLDKREQLPINYHDLKTLHFITCFFNTNTHPFPQFEITKPEIGLKIKIEKAKQPLNVGELPPLTLGKPDNFDINHTTPNEILSLLPLNNTFPHSYTHLVARYCYHNSLSFESFLSWYQQKNNTTEATNKWKYHWSKLEQFPNVKRETMLSLLVKFYPTLRRQKGYEKFTNLFTLPEDKINKIDRVSPSDFTTDNKFVIINTGMGSGKTSQAIDFLINQNSFIWMTPLETLAQNTHHRLEEKNILCKYYKDFKNRQEKLTTLPNYDKIIICINSLYYTNTRNYNIVVIDEIETLLGKWFNNSTLNEHKNDCWKRFLEIINNADKVILLDAFTSKITLNFIQQLQNPTYQITELKHYDADRTIMYAHNFLEWKMDIIEALKQNKKLFLFYPYVNKNSKFPSMNDLLTVIENATGKKGTAYNAQTDDDIVKQLKNVNSSWSTQDFIITNTKITVGVNYDNLFSIFDMVFLSIAGFNTSRDIMQVSMRCRALKEKLIKVVLLESQNTFNTFENDDIKVDGCPIYKNLVKDILIEKQAPLQQSFQFLCQKAGYKMKVNNSILRTDLEAYFSKFYADCNLAYSYDTIPDIDAIQSEEITQRIFESKATLEDKLSQKKYFYKMQFNNKDAEELTIGWDKRYSLFFDKIKLMMHEEEENLYFKIKEFNKWDSIFPEDTQLNKVKLNNELVDEIFEKYHFKDLTKASKPKAIIKNIYNAYFGKNIISSCADNNKHYKLTIKEETRILYYFSLDNLKVNKNEYEYLGPDMFNDDDLPEEKEDIKHNKNATKIFIDFNSF